MQTTYSLPQSQSSLGDRIVEFLLAKLFSQHIKRIIFVTSLYTQLNRLDHLKQSAREKLNYIMALANDRKALDFPARFQGMVWRKTNLHEKIPSDLLSRQLTPDETRAYSMMLVDISPKWIRYGSKPAMADDVCRLLTEPSFQAAAA